MIDIHVAHIDQREGANLYAAVSRELLMAKIAAFCREYWSEIADDRDRASLNDEETARVSFERHPNDYLQTDRVAIDGQPISPASGKGL